MAENAPIIVVGAGPGGLTAALALADAGVPVIVLEREATLAFDLRAGTYHPPTLEMLARWGITERMLARGVKVPRWQIRDRSQGVLVEFDLSLLKDDTPYPMRLQLEQHKLTPMLLEACRRYPHFDIRFSHPVEAIRQNADGVSVMVGGDGDGATLSGSYLVGADGHHSVVRESLGIAFDGFTWPERFLILATPYDFAPHGFTNAAYTADPEEWVMLFKVPGLEPPALWRAAFPADAALPAEELTSDEAVQDRLQRFLPRHKPYEVVHRNLYRVHQRVASTYFKGRAALVGDAAHVNNPLGGMGLNGAIHDAVNLAGALTAMWRSEAGDDALALYDRQRRPLQIAYVQRITIANKRLVEERDPAARARRHAELRALADDPVKQRKYLLDRSMISMIREEATIV